MASPPDLQWNIGSALLNGADGDSLREAAAKYNAHEHPGGGGGLAFAIETVTTSAPITAAAYEDFQITGAGPNGIIGYAEFERLNSTTGSSVTVKVMDRDPTDPAAVTCAYILGGPSYVGDAYYTLTADTVQGTITVIAGSYVPGLAASYFTNDGDTLWVRIYNYSGMDTIEARVTLHLATYTAA
jgi:hypothetical protein